MKTLRWAGVVAAIIILGACNRVQHQPSSSTSMQNDSGRADLPSDSTMMILRAYSERRITADVAAKALFDEAARSKTSLAVEMDDSLRAAVTREVARRRGQ